MKKHRKAGAGDLGSLMKNLQGFPKLSVFLDTGDYCIKLSKHGEMAIVVEAVSIREESSGHEHSGAGEKGVCGGHFLHTLSTFAHGPEEGFAIALSLTWEG